MTGSAHRGQCFSLLLCGEHSWRNVSFPLGTIGEERRSIWVRVDPFGKLLLRLFEHNGESSGIGDVPSETNQQLLLNAIPQTESGTGRRIDQAIVATENAYWGEVQAFPFDLHSHSHALLGSNIHKLTFLS